MKSKLAKKIRLGAALLLMAGTSAFAQSSGQIYTPTPENIKARQEFQDNKFGIFLHWGIYSMTAQGEWYMNTHNINRDEYAKLASGFYPSRFNAAEWVSAIKPPVPDISVSPAATMTVSPCLIQKNPIIIS